MEHVTPEKNRSARFKNFFKSVLHAVTTVLNLLYNSVFRKVFKTAFRQNGCRRSAAWFRAPFCFHKIPQFSGLRMAPPFIYVKR